MGLVGGGPGSFIGPVHFRAAIMDGEIELVAEPLTPIPLNRKLPQMFFILSRTCLWNLGGDV
jgi:hypothetical protein